MDPLIGKRKKRKVECVNPLFVQWLTEWKDEAADNGWKTQYTFNKALNTLKKFPLTLSCGKDCRMLQNFGTTAPIVRTESVITSRAGTGISTHTTSTISTSTTSPRMEISGPRIDSGIVSDESDVDEQPSQQRKRRKSLGNKAPREYIPAFRSGPYAILLALYRNAQNPNSIHDFMTHTEIIQAAEPLADNSFTVPDPGCRYTAWSSMGTLIKKGLVIKNSSPARYSLTQSGKDLADRLESVDGTSPHTAGSDRSAMSTNKISLSVKSPDVESLSAMDDWNDGMPNLPSLDLPQVLSSHKQSEQPGLPQTSNRFHFWFVTDDNRLVTSKDEAAVSIDEVNSISFLVKCNYQQLLKSGKTYKLDTSRPLGDDVFAYLCDTDADDIACPPSAPQPDKQKQATESVKPKPQKPRKLNTTNRTAAEPVPKETSLRERLLGVQTLTSDVVLEPQTIARDVLASVQSKRADTLSSLTTRTENTGLFASDSQDSTVSDKIQNSDSQSSTVSSVSSASGLPPTDFVFAPGSFDIILCVDNREFYGGGKTNNKPLLPDLIRNGVECDLRPLHVGDMLWIAREKSQKLPGQIRKPQGRELVLDYVIERKRMDDLVSSTIDGRFREQKFRLKRCGVQNAIYLIEEYGSMQHFSISEDKLKQAITNTQVIDGFQIKKTHDVKETVTYLTVLTRYLQSYYRGKTLHACNLEVLQDMRRNCQLQDGEQILIEFQHFNHGSLKSKNLTVHEMFGKQLIQLHGMSADKAKAIVDQYPTVMHLYDAYSSCHTDKERESLLANIKVGKLGRNMGIGQSRQICHLYWTNSALT
ncbi:crossover junction endonuclease MUS81-like isoform X2 [Gigantopelta aegis]|uniref:crossover junction endonuclease MUS81-like isoform X2 n=1 Tax=Gigantopelta aegis TaxID=1735272 RepID=UPI001B8880AD|nr:crossover junction endonuclease MUS81-like isoform X2 [Gigantopelta aegis]